MTDPQLKVTWLASSEGHMARIETLEDRRDHLLEPKELSRRIGLDVRPGVHGAADDRHDPGRNAHRPYVSYVPP